ncbi:hypothetical protein LFREDSHE_31780 [Shewanella baltica]
MEKTFNLTRRDDGIAILTMDVPGESMNTLKEQFGPEISEILAEIKSDSSIRGLVLISGKKILLLRAQIFLCSMPVKRRAMPKPYPSKAMWFLMS